MITYDFQDRENETLYEYLYRKIRQDIRTGQLPPGERMPSKRSFAANLGVSVITVETAYDQLTAEGYLSARPRSGYYVEQIGQSLIIPEDSGHADRRSQEGKAGGHADRRLQEEKAGGITCPGSVIGKPENPLTEEAGIGEKGTQKDWIDLSQSGISSSMFPYPVWSRLMREILRTRRDELLTRSPGNGIAELRTAIARFLLQYQNLRVSPEQIVIGAGTEYLYGLLIRLLGYDKVYAVETPGYRKTERIYRSCGVAVRSIPMDPCGVDVELLRESGADVIHISPSHQFPTGITMPVSRRSELLSWSMEGNEKNRRFIIEDDYDSEFRLAGRPIPSLMSIDRFGSVIYLNTFTKSVSPSIRISYMVLPEGLLQEYREKLGFYSCTVASFEQYLLAEFIRQGHFEKHINRMRSYYRQKRDRMLGALKQSGLGDRVKVSGADAGLHFLLRVETGYSEEELTRRARKKGVLVFGLSRYEASGSESFRRQKTGRDRQGASDVRNRRKPGTPFREECPVMVVNYPGLTDEQIDILPELLKEAWFPVSA